MTDRSDDQPPKDDRDTPRLYADLASWWPILSDRADYRDHPDQVSAPELRRAPPEDFALPDVRQARRL